MSPESSTPGIPGVRVFPDAQDLWVGAAHMLLDAVSRLGPGARLVFPGGRTPGALFDRVVSLQSALPWNTFWYLTSDERCVPVDHPDSNAGLLRSRLLRPLGVGDERLLRFRGEDPPERGAEKAHRELVDLAQRVPLFDLVILGLGEDGHTASLFPAESWPDFGMRWAAVLGHPQGEWRLTLTPAALRSTRATWFLVSGAAKAPAVAQSITAPQATSRVPAREVVGPEVVWLLDRDAAGDLPDSWRPSAS